MLFDRDRIESELLQPILVIMDSCYGFPLSAERGLLAWVLIAVLVEFALSML